MTIIKFGDFAAKEITYEHSDGKSYPVVSRLSFSAIVQNKFLKAVDLMSTLSEQSKNGANVSEMEDIAEQREVNHRHILKMMIPTLPDKKVAQLSFMQIDRFIVAWGEANAVEETEEKKT